MPITSPRQRARRVYTPLSVAASIELVTPASPLEQIYNSEESQYEPNRALSPLKIRPIISIATEDGSVNPGCGNKLLANYTWYVNGVDISTLSAWSGFYTIDTSNSDNRGSIEITKNVSVAENFSLVFKGEILDTRTGNNVPVETQPVVLVTHTQSEDSWSVSLDHDTAMEYNPFLDKLLEYDYEVANGLKSESSSLRSAATDRNSYLRKVNVTVAKGSANVQSGFSLKLFKKSGGSWSEITTSNTPELTELTTSHFTLDLRMVESANYLLKVIVDSAEVARTQFSIGRRYPEFFIRTLSGADMENNAREIGNRCSVTAMGNVVKHPEAILKLAWKTATPGSLGSEVVTKWQEGSVMKAKVSETGFNGATDSYIDVFCEAEQRQVASYLTSSSGEYYTDADGNQYIDF